MNRIKLPIATEYIQVLCYGEFYCFVELPLQQIQIQIRIQIQIQIYILPPQFYTLLTKSFPHLTFSPVHPLLTPFPTIHFRSHPLLYSCHILHVLPYSPRILFTFSTLCVHPFFPVKCLIRSAISSLNSLLP